MLHEREFEQIKGILSQRDANKAIVIQIQAPSGYNSYPLIDKIIRSNSDFQLLFSYNYTIQSRLRTFSLPYVMNVLLSSSPGKFLNYTETLPKSLQKIVQETSISPEKSAILRNVISDYLRYLAADSVLCFNLQGLQPAPETNSFISLLESLHDIPMVIFNSVKDEVSLESDLPVQPVQMKRLSVIETERLLAEDLQMNSITARLITNFVHIKSDGNERKIRCMVEAYYQSLFHKDPMSLVTSGELQQIQASASLEEIFKTLLERFGSDVVGLLAMIAKMDDPLPKSDFQEICTMLKVSSDDVSLLFKTLLLRDENEYIHMDWPELRVYLKRNTPIDHTLKPLQYFNGELLEELRGFNFQISDQLFDIGNKPMAINFAYREARGFRVSRQPERALERFSFIKRNLAREPEQVELLRSVLRESGELQRERGLFEVAFESFRELRELLHRDFPEEWVAVTLQMADVLIEMDAYSEARYLLQEIKIKNIAGPNEKALAGLLYGKVERYCGNPGYAIRHYEEAAVLLPEIADERLSWRVYDTLIRCYEEENRQDKLQQLIERSNELFENNGRYYLRARLDHLRRLLKTEKYTAALPEVIALYRGYRNLDATAHKQLKLYLSEIYAFLGKWYLSRSHLLQLLKMPLLMTGTANRLQLLFNLGIVEKELARYGPAMQNLTEAGELALEIGQEGEYQRIMAHLGHAHMLVRGFVRAGELLNASHRWAKEQHDEELLLQTSLFLASYEMQHARLDSAMTYLSKGKSFVNLLDHSLEKLNYIYYLVSFHLEANDLEKAGDIVGFWEEQCRGIAKFENLALWLSGRVAMKKSRLEKAEPKLNEALDRAQRFKLPHLEFLVVRDLAALAKEQGDAENLGKFIKMAHQSFEKLLDAVGDPILRQQLEESREYDMLLNLSL